MYFLTTGLIHIGVAKLLPNPYRKLFQAATTVMQLKVIGGNKSIGLKVRF